MTCPDYPTNCRSPGSTQRYLTESEKMELTDRAANFSGLAERCDYCGLIFVQGNPFRRLGWMASMMGPGFQPARDYE